MSDTVIPFQTAPSDPKLKDLLDIWKKEILLNFNCHHIGTVQSFDTENQTATATINYKKTYFQLDRASGLYKSILVDYPILVDCPVICLGGGKGALMFPIAQGDECLISFNDRDIDTWFQGATGAAVATGRLHSFSDGIITVGVRSLANVLTDYDPARVVLRNKDAKIALGETLIKIANDTQDIKTILNDLISKIEGLTSVPLSPLDIIQMELVRARVNALFE